MPAVFGFPLQPFPEVGWPLRCPQLAHLPQAPPHWHWFVHSGDPVESQQKGSQNMFCFIDCNPDPGVLVFFIEVLFDQNRITLPEFLGLTFLGDLEIC